MKDMLQQLMSSLRDEDFKLAELDADIRIPVFENADIGTELLKCAIVIAACTRASKYNAAAQQGTAKIQESDENGTKPRIFKIHYENHVKRYLLEICDSEGEGEAYTGTLWLCLHVQQHDFSTGNDGYFYYRTHFRLTETVQKSSVDKSCQGILDNALNEVSEIKFGNLSRESQLIFTKFLHMDNAENWKQNVLLLKIRAIRINGDLASGVMAWSSVDTVYIAADHHVPHGILSALARSANFAGSTFCLRILVAREVARCIARMRAAIAGLWPDPTSYSAEAVGICDGLPLEAERVALGIPWTRSFDLDAGHVAEQLMVGALIDVSMLWTSLEINPSRWKCVCIPATETRCQPRCPKEIIRMLPDFLSGMSLSFTGHNHLFY
jgi:hypothetical protein